MESNTDVAQMALLNELKHYEPSDDVERIELVRFISFLENNKNVFSRDNLTGHVTASSWLVNKDKTKVFMIHHNIYNSWAPMGGHSDGDTNLLNVAIKESHEESGIQNITVLDKNILDIAVFTVREHNKKGKTVPLHFHFDVRYLFEADENEAINTSDREVSDGRWFNIDELEDLNIDIIDIVKRVMKKVH